MAEVEYDMHTSPARTYAASISEVDPCLENGHLFNGCGGPGVTL
jgi:hypothetical protein